jgi:hypothetical protein
MHIEQVIARERQARQRRYALANASQHALSQTLASCQEQAQTDAADSRRRYDRGWNQALNDSLRRFGAEATGRALLSLGRAVRFRRARA